MPVTVELKSELFDKGGTLKNNVLKELVNEITEAVADVTKDSVQKEVDSLTTFGSGEFNESIVLKKVSDTEYKIMSGAEASVSGFPYGEVIERGFTKDKMIVPFLNKEGGETDIVQYLLRNGWKRGKRSGELVTPLGNTRKWVEIKNKDGRHPFKKGFFNSRTKWNEVSVSVILDKLTI